MSEEVKASQGTKKKTSPYMKVMDDLSEFCSPKSKQLLGQILTTLEATVDDERKLEALRSRVKDIHWLTWEEMNQELWGSLDIFEKKDAYVDWESFMSRAVQAFLTKYGGVVQTLILAVFDDRRRASALNKEIIRLIYVTRDSIRRALSQIMASAFPVLSEKTEEEKK